MVEIVKVGGELLVNTQVAGFQEMPSITGLSGGGFVATWTDYSGVSGLGVAKAQLYSAAGTKVGGEFAVASGAATDQSFPTVSSLAGGGFVVTWTEAGIQSDYKIKAQVYSASGAVMTPAFLVNSTTWTQQGGNNLPGNHNPTITGLSGGGFVVTWQDYAGSAGDASGAGILSQLYSAAGVPVGGAARVNTQTTGDQTQPTVTSLAGGGYVVTWMDGTASGTAMKAQLFSAAGAKIGGEIAVDAKLLNDQSLPVVTGLATGGFVVAWQDSNPAIGQPDTLIRAQVFSAAGAKVGGSLVVSDTSAGERDFPAIAGLPNGGFVVTWQHFVSPTNSDIKAQVFDGDGTKLGGEMLINTVTAGYQERPVITSVTGDGFVIAWGDGSGLGGDADGTSIKAQLYTYGIYNVITGTDGIDAMTGATSDDHLIGLASNDTLTGLGGNDLLDGGTGSDTMIGGLGDDIYVVDVAGDVVTELAGQGTDTVQTKLASYLLGNNVENLTFTDNAAHTGVGNALNNVLTGGGGADNLNGGAGADRMVGGLGNDTYTVDNSGDTTIEAAGGGTDTVSASISWTLAANVENLVLSGTAAINGTGNDDANSLNGNSGANVLTGLGGNDTLNGGAGADTMIGGLGNDTYVVDNAGDVTTEAAGEGTDGVSSSISWTLAANVENLTLSGSAAINGTGNTDANVINGNSAANVLTGLGGNDTLNGGAGADTMVGGLGDDSYVVDNAGDVVTELAGQGTDIVMSSITWTLGANLENLTLSGSAAINATGNTDANVLVGNSGANTLTGLGGNDTLNGGAGSDTMIGGLGDDAYTVDSTGDVVTELVGEGTDVVQTTLSSYTLVANVENLTFTNSSAHTGTGNALANVITGNAGNDTLNGGAGADTLLGGFGNDSYVVDDAGDAVTEFAAQGTDLVTASVSYTISANVENLTLSGTAAINGTGNTDANVLTGNSGANVLTGLGGNDTLNGGAGNDTMIGGLGDDIYVVDAAGDVVTELVGDGTDTVQTTLASHTLAANVERLTFTSGSSHTGIGNALANVITGNTGNDVLDGGAGADTLIGGAGNDSYVVDNAGDVTTELAAQGTDLVTASISWTLAANIENLTLSGTAALSGTGTNEANVLTGNSGNNVLTGLGGNDTLNGGAGSDTMIGGLGDDIYVVDAAGDVVTELAGEGTDTVQTVLASYTLGANVERLTFTNSSAHTGIGNALANVITGNGGADVLDGGAGADTLIGGSGNDSYVVDNALDVTTEAASGGTDLVTASLSWTLAVNVENLTLSGSAAIDGTGNVLGNVLTGNTGNNVLSGLDGNDTLTGGLGADTLLGGIGNDRLVGGLGNDTLNGGTGTDTFVFDTAPNAATNFDTLQDFTSGTDKLSFSRAVYTGFAATGAMSVDAFWSGTGVNTAHDATDRFIYNTATGVLWYDADGTGASAAVQVAQLTGAPALAFSDFLIAV
ncbi:calcium-binding protein [Novosphingobium sp.]|uniref:beta strand repeat-containing protein n=1 Tax=Novosphingobium sp. TaxID=1874826 RepID=UPI002605C9F0|nr:calcium-binding protein [Novosphingobium sp.]